MEPNDFHRLSAKALAHIDDRLGGLELEELDVQLAGDVPTLAFADGGRFVINAHSAAGQIWMAAGTTAWHFDFEPDQGRWIAKKSADELMSTVARVVGAKLGTDVSL
jgi:CyaY protein